MHTLRHRSYVLQETFTTYKVITGYRRFLSFNQAYADIKADTILLCFKTTT